MTPEDAQANSPRTARLTGLFWPAALLAGCICAFIFDHSYQNSRRPAAPQFFNANFHLRVFEADAGLVDSLVPFNQRQTPSQANARDLPKFQIQTTRNGVAVTNDCPVQCDSQFVQIKAGILSQLIAGSGMLVNQTNSVSSIWWNPGSPACWSYNYKQHGLNGIGQGSCFMGLRQTNGVVQIHIVGNLNQNLFHVSKSAQNSYSIFYYEGNRPPNGDLAFLIPFQRERSPHYLVATFEVN